ncbi:MAG: ABC transporter substrate-binding protein [Clostridiales bacterium]|nr:ABC transporter substrate-binding protein [Clostridiales bacterium]
MKKILTAILSALLMVTALFSIGCGGEEQSKDKLSLYVPDGAPALSVARLLNDKELVADVDINVVGASTIQTFVTGESPKADLAIMPVNAAVKMLASKGEYKLVGTVTNGNIFIMKKATGQNITADNLSELIGKKVGVMNLANVPGLTFKAILSDRQIGYVDITESGVVQSDKVNLIALPTGQEGAQLIVPSSDCDYFVVAEPLATTKQNATQGKISIAGSLQALYGDGNGYPQAVLVVKTSVLENNNDTVKALINSFDENVEWLTSEQTAPQTIVDAVKSGFVDSEMSATFTANNLNVSVINNCAIDFTPASECKGAVKGYIAKLNAITSNAWGNPVDEFFYTV